MPAAEKILRRMPEPLAGILRRTEKPLLEKATEIRLRADAPLALSVGEQTVFLSPQGRPVPPEQGYTVKQELVQQTMIALSGHSLHGIEKTLFFFRCIDMRDVFTSWYLIAVLNSVC